MNSRQISLKLWRELEFNRGHRPVVPNAYLCGWFECDVASVTKAGYWWEFEIKVSRADFKIDSSKGGKPNRVTPSCNKHEALTNGKGPSRFCYVTPAGLLKPEEIPEFAGLWEVHDMRRRPVEVKRPPQLHDRKLDAAVVSGLYEKMYWRYWRHLETCLKTNTQRAKGGSD